MLYGLRLILLPLSEQRDLSFISTPAATIKKANPFLEDWPAIARVIFVKTYITICITVSPPFYFYKPLKHLSQVSHLLLFSFLIDLSNCDLHIKLFLFINLLEAYRKVTWQKGRERWNDLKWVLEWQMRMKKEVQIKILVVQTFSQVNS